MKNFGIAIVGVSAKMPGCDNYKEFQQAIFKGEVHTNRNLHGQRLADIESLFGAFKAAPMSYLDRIDLFDHDFFGISKGEANRMRPEQRLMLEQTVNCILNSGKSLKDMRGSNTGIFAAKGDSQFKLLFDGKSKSSMAELSLSMDVARIAYTLDLRGPAMIVDTTCSSSLVALHLACQNILDGTCDQALIGGVSIWVIPENAVETSPILSKKLKCCAFDASADGTLLGEGALMVMLKSEQKAIEDGDFIHGVIEASALNHGGARIANITSPSPDAQAEVISRAWHKAGITARNIAFIESHGTGTVLGDPIEINGISKAIGKSDAETEIAIGAIKSQFGHLDGASGIAGLVKLILAFDKKLIPPLVNFNQLNPNIEVTEQIKFPAASLPWPKNKNYGAVSSFGVSGTNVHAVIRVPSFQEFYGTEKFSYVIVLKANSVEMINNMRVDIAGQVKNSASPGEVQAICKTINQILPDGKFEFVYTAFTVIELLKKMAKPVEEETLLKMERETICFISHNADFEETAFKNLTNCFPQLNNIYQNELKVFAEKTELPAVVSFCRLLSYIEWLMECGLEINKFIVSGIGNIVSDFLNKRINVSDVLKQISTLDLTFSEDKFIQLARTYQSNDTAHLIHLGNSGGMLDVMEKFIQKKTTLLIHRDLYQQTNMIIENIIKLNSSAIYGTAKQVYPMIIDVFNRERCWPKTIGAEVKSVETPLVQKEMKQVHEQQLVSSLLIREEISRIWKEILDVEKINVDDDFFNIGGTSLIGLDVQDEIAKRFQVKLDYEDVFEYATIQKLTNKVFELVNRVNNDVKVENTIITVPSEEERLHQYNQLVEKAKAFIPDIKQPKKVLLTGVTGFLGVHLLKQLLEQTDAKIICPVRKSANQSISDRLSVHFNFHCEGFVIPNNRLELLEVDLLKEELPPIDNVDIIYHSAAVVSHFGKRSLSHDGNVVLTKRITEWAINNKATKIIYISTSAVGGYLLADRDRYAYYEVDGNIGQTFEGSIYPETKFEAENYLRSQLDKIDVAIVRVANISGYSKTGRFQKNVFQNASLLFLRDIINLGKYPKSLTKSSTNLNPVDIVSAAVLKLSMLQNAPVNAFHINDPDTITFGYVMDTLRNLNITMEEIEDANFGMAFVGREQDEVDKLPMINILKTRRDVEDVYSTFQTKLTYTLLEKLKFDWSFNKELFLTELIKGQVENGFFLSNKTVYSKLEIENVKKVFFERLGYELNLEKPSTFNEKIRKRIIYGDHQKLAQIADKLQVREYVKAKVGDKYLIPLWGVYDQLNETDLETMPKDFVIKTNHASGPNYMQVFADGKPVYPVKKQSVSKILKRINNSLNDKYGDVDGEKFYNLIKPKILVEKYLCEKDGSPLKEYKLFCFTGSKKIIIAVVSGRVSLNPVVPLFYDENWNKLEITAAENYSASDFDVQRPKNLDEMLTVARKLSEDLDFTRVDLYTVEDRIYFGELTNTPSAGYFVLYPREWDRKMGEMFVQTNW